MSSLTHEEEKSKDEDNRGPGGQSTPGQDDRDLIRLFRIPDAVVPSHIH